MDGRSRFLSIRFGGPRHQLEVVGYPLEYSCSICARIPPTNPVRSSSGQLFCLPCLHRLVHFQGQANPHAPIPPRSNCNGPPTPSPSTFNPPLRVCKSSKHPVPVGVERLTAEVSRDVLDRLHRLEVLSAALEVSFDAERKHYDWRFVAHLELLLRAIWSE